MASEENEAEPHSMWEYPCRALSEVFNVLRFDFTSQIPDEKQEVNSTIEFTRYRIPFIVYFDQNMT